MLQKKVGVIRQANLGSRLGVGVGPAWGKAGVGAVSSLSLKRTTLLTSYTKHCTGAET